MMLKTTSDVVGGGGDATPDWRQMPHNIQAEQGLLGAVLVNNAVLDRIADIVVPADFYDPLHAEIFSVCSALIQNGKLVTPITLRTFFENAEPIDENLTVPQYLVRLATHAAVIISAPSYAQTVHDLATRRRLIMIGEDIVTASFNAEINAPPKKIIEEAERELYAIAERTGQPDAEVPISVAIDEALGRVEDGMRRGGRMSGIATGLIDLDLILGGLEDDALYIGAGRPGMGKTGFVTGIAWHVASKLGLPVHFFSLEMPRYQLANRILASITDINSDKIRRGDVTDAEYRLLYDARERFKATPLHIDHRGGLSISQLVARARRVKRLIGTRLLIVDYLQLMASRSDNRVGEITEITTGLKALAKELHVPVFALSQLSRAVETRQDKRPMLSDLRESGSIEQDADAVMFLFREEYYHQQVRPPESDIAKRFDWDAKQRQIEGKAEVAIPKNRAGMTGVVEVMFHGPTASFGNLARARDIGGRHD